MCRYWYGWHLTIWQRGGVLHGGREPLRGWEGRVCFTLFHLVCKFPWQICLAWCLGLCVGVACFWLVLFLVGFFLPGKFVFNLMLIPVVDRPCLALVRQCRKKKDRPAKRQFESKNAKEFEVPQLLGRTCLWRTVSDSISGAENCTVTRRSPAHWPVMSEGNRHVFNHLLYQILAWNFSSNVIR